MKAIWCTRVWVALVYILFFTWFELNLCPRLWLNLLDHLSSFANDKTHRLAGHWDLEQAKRRADGQWQCWDRTISKKTTNKRLDRELTQKQVQTSQTGQRFFLSLMFSQLWSLWEADSVHKFSLYCTTMGKCHSVQSSYRVLKLLYTWVANLQDT